MSSPNQSCAYRDYDVLAVVGLIAFFRHHTVALKPRLSAHRFFNISSEGDIFY